MYMYINISELIIKNISQPKMSNISQQQHVPQPNTFPVYSKQFILKPYLVMDHTNKSKKQMEDFMYAFTKRIDTQLTYQKNLNQCAKILQKYIDPTTQKCISYISSAFKVDNQQRGNQAKQLADSLRTQVIEPLKQSLNKFTNLSKKAEKNFKKLNKDYAYYQDKYKSAKQDYNKTDNDLKQMIITKNIYKYTSEYSQDKKNKLVSKSMEGIKQKMQYQKNYKISVNQLNEFLEIYQRDAVDMLNQLELAQRQQIKLQSDGIRKLIVCEVSMFKNVEYDLINISKQMEKMYAETDIQHFKKQTVVAIVNEEQSDKVIKDMNLKAIEIDKSLLAFSLKNVQEDYHAWLLLIKKNKALRKIMELRMKQITPLQEIKKDSQQTAVTEQQQKSQKTKQPATKEEQPASNGVNNEVKVNSQNSIQYNSSTQWKILPKQLFNPPPNPNGIYQKLSPQQCYQDFSQLSLIINKAFTNSDPSLTSQSKSTFIQILQKNHFMRIIAYLFIQQYRIQHRVLMKWESYQKAGQLTKVVIDSCDKFGDVFTLKGLLALIFTFYSIKDQKSKKLMYQMPNINQCQVWKKQDYWEASIFESTYEQMVNFNVQKGETHGETLLRQKNIIFSQLASYCHYMLMLNTSSKNVRRIVGRYCRLYEMTEDQNRDLSKMISNTAKQIKQLNSPLVNTAATTTTTTPNIGTGPQATTVTVAASVTPIPTVTTTTPPVSEIDASITPAQQQPKV